MELAAMNTAVHTAMHASVEGTHFVKLTSGDPFIIECPSFYIENDVSYTNL